MPLGPNDLGREVVDVCVNRPGLMANSFLEGSSYAPEQYPSELRERAVLGAGAPQ